MMKMIKVVTSPFLSGRVVCLEMACRRYKTAILLKKRDDDCDKSLTIMHKGTQQLHQHCSKKIEI